MLVVGVAGVAGLLGWTVLTVVFEDREKGGWVAGIAAAPLTGVPLIVALWNWYRRSTAPPAGPGPPAVCDHMPDDQSDDQDHDAGSRGLLQQVEHDRRSPRQ